MHDAHNMCNVPGLNIKKRKKKRKEHGQILRPTWGLHLPLIFQPLILTKYLTLSWNQILSISLEMENVHLKAEIDLK